MNRTRHRKRLLPHGLTAILACALLSFPTNAETRFTVHGFTLPQPKKVPRLFAQRAAVRPAPISCPVRFELSSRGEVESVAIDYQPGDSLVFAVYRDSLTRVEFAPAELDGEALAVTVEARLLVTPTHRSRLRVTLITPVDSSGRLMDYELLEKTCQRASVRLAGLATFPPYFYARPRLAEDTAGLYEFVLLEIELDDRGEPIDRRTLLATDAALGNMALTASGWAQYSPAESPGRLEPARGLLLLRLFTELQYPTTEWLPGSSGILTDQPERSRVSWWSAHGIDSLRIPAAPRRAAAPRIQIARELGAAPPARGVVSIDTLGRSTILTLNGALTTRVRSTLVDWLSKIKFYPGLRVDISNPDSPDWGRRPDSLLFELTPVDTFAYELRVHPANR